jgi:hypothetical protein
MPSSTVDITLGFAPEVYQLFSYASPALALTDVISHGFNQSLQRDMYYGSWADAYIHDDGEYRVKLTSPTHDLQPYVDRVTEYLNNGRLALKAYNTQVLRSNGFQFLLPFGLAMTNVKSVQLFHFPPNETFYYQDYLYSPTNRRWECLLQQNGFDGRDNTLVERIVDVVPIAAAGGAMKQIEPYNQAFVPYGKAQLETFLDGDKEYSQPVVGYGGPVRDWLWTAYKDQITEACKVTDGKNPLHTMSLIELNLVGSAKTPILCANHPSMYLYDTDIPVDQAEEAKKSSSGSSGDDYPPPIAVMRDDLVAAGWQAVMSKDWGADAADVKAKMEARWADDDKVKDIMREQNTEFGFSS